MSARLTMVATDAATKKSAPVNPLTPTNKEEEDAIRRGEENKKRRLQSKANSLQTSPPTEEERSLIHKIFMESKKPDRNHVFMSKTHNQSVILCQPSDRNIHGKIFGGYLMRKGFELAFSTAFLFARSQPAFVALEDVTFFKPVEIGDILRLNSRVVFTQDKSVQVEVLATVTDPYVGEEQTTNVFNFTFECPSVKDGDVKKVLPTTYEEAMVYLQGRRIFLTAHEKSETQI
eukprot:TRINITY_DN2113_c0_g1_i3.p1 TRINITY_DN2113_c0_g1~~TRINITY_DN2113_c0_g1_i3.p1  ORF type:complete len:232 (+),score=84.77 TRINITY_DN2113_c0_g1_i3:605-1300(+)